MLTIEEIKVILSSLSDLENRLRDNVTYGNSDARIFGCINELKTREIH
jgi:hypothetical protein